MAKHVNIPLHNSIATARIDVERFAAFTQQLEADPRSRMSYPQSWLDTSLLSRTNDGSVEVTPRGEDLLASIDSLPNDLKPEIATSKQCARCGGETTVPLFMGPMSGGATMPCPACSNEDGSPKTSHSRAVVVKAALVMGRGRRISSTQPNIQSLPRATTKVEHPWVLIDSEEVARSFVGRRVEIDVPDGMHPMHRLHGACCSVAGNVNTGHLTLGYDGINWRSRGNVRLRIVDGDAS